MGRTVVAFSIYIHLSVHGVCIFEGGLQKGLSVCVFGLFLECANVCWGLPPVIVQAIAVGDGAAHQFVCVGIVQGIEADREESTAHFRDVAVVVEVGAAVFAEDIVHAVGSLLVVAA